MNQIEFIEAWVIAGYITVSLIVYWVMGNGVYSLMNVVQCLSKLPALTNERAFKWVVIIFWPLILIIIGKGETKNERR